MIIATKKRVISLLVGLYILTVYQSFRLMATVTADQDGVDSKASQFDAPTLVLQHVSNSSINNNSPRNNTVTSPAPIMNNRLVHVTIFGIGHRLCRTSAAWHLAKRLNLTSMKFQWGTCGPDHSSGPRIFSYLFGAEELVVPSSPITIGIGAASSIISNPPDHDGRGQQQGKEILLRNDVYGYVPGQNLKDFQRFIPPLYQSPEGPFLQKLDSDVQLYQMLADRYQFQDDVKDFMEQHKFKEHTVVGLHLRAGNGEETHFEESGRYIANETEFVSNLCDLLHTLLDKVTVTYPKSLPPLIFLATDTPSLIPMIVKTTLAFGVPTVVLPQIRVPGHQKGVTFKALQGAGDEKCLQGWQAMISDMLLLSQSTILIAARHSSFTQSMPLSLVLGRKNKQDEQPGPHFCEVSSLATTMTCVQDASSWLFRNDDTKMTTYTLQQKQGKEEMGPVVHKLLVHLPDLEVAKEFSEAVWFLGEQTTEAGSEAHAVRRKTHSYGAKRFNPKYRKRKKKHEAFSWNFQVPE